MENKLDFEFWQNVYEQYDNQRRVIYHDLVSGKVKADHELLKEYNGLLEKIRWIRHRLFKSHRKHITADRYELKRFAVAGTHIFDKEDQDWMLQLRSREIAEIVVNKLNEVHEQ